MSRADRLSWTIARYASRIPGGSVFAASSCASAGIRIAQEMFGSTLYQSGRGGAYDLRGILSIHARHWLFNGRPHAHIDLPAIFDTLSRPNALLATPAQVDGSCNANLSVVGDHARPKVAFGGTRGLPDARSIHFVLPAHNPRQLVANVSFVSTAAAHRKVPAMLFTELCVMIWDQARSVWTLDAMAPETTIDAIRARTGFAFEAVERPALLEDPPEDVQRLLQDIDPLGVRDLDFVTDRSQLLDAYERLYAAEARMAGMQFVPAHRQGGLQ